MNLQCLLLAELNDHVRGVGKTGKFLMTELDTMMKSAGGIKMGEAYVLGNSPLTLVTALQTAWEADPASCDYKELPCSEINNDDRYRFNSEGRTIRVYTRLDLRLMIEDFYAKIKCCK